MLIALTRPVSASFADCELSFLSRTPIDVVRAHHQHIAYESALESLGVRVQRVPAAPALPDAVFLEDTAVVVDEAAVITRPGAPSRRAETAAVARVLSGYRKLLRMKPPATLDGGDVLHIGRILYVGLTTRTNQAGIDQLQRLLAPWDYRVVPVQVTGCLHLKTAVTLASDNLLLLNPAWLAPKALKDVQLDRLEVDPREPFAANALVAGGKVIYPTHFPHTAGRLAAHGVSIVPVEYDEIAKAEGAVTCCTILLRA